MGWREPKTSGTTVDKKSGKTVDCTTSFLISSLVSLRTPSLLATTGCGGCGGGRGRRRRWVQVVNGPPRSPHPSPRLFPRSPQSAEKAPQYLQPRK